MTPRVTLDGDIILDLTVESSARGADVNVAGTNLPSFGSRKVGTRLRLRDGESNLLAGLLREDERKSLSGFPGAIRVPILKQLFSNNDQTIGQTDIVMLLTPHIVRTPEITEADLKPIYIGSQQNLGDRRAAAAHRRAATPSGGCRAGRRARRRLDAAAARVGARSQSDWPVAAPPGTTFAPPPGTTPVPGTVAGARAASGARTPPAAPAPPAPPQPPPPRQRRRRPTGPPIAGHRAAQVVAHAAGHRPSASAAGRTRCRISIANASRLSTVTLTLTFDPALLRVRAVQEGSFMRPGGANATFTQQVAPGPRRHHDRARGRCDRRVRAPGCSARCCSTRSRRARATLDVERRGNRPGRDADGPAVPAGRDRVSHDRRP